jgi:hypothetical protein
MPVIEPPLQRLAGFIRCASRCTIDHRPLFIPCASTLYLLGNTKHQTDVTLGN